MTYSRPVRLCVLVFALVVAGSTVSARTINVAAGHSIQTAINAAVKGDVVVVAAGTYKENLDFRGKAITVKSTNPTSRTVVAATIVNGDKKGSVVTFKTGETAKSVLTGFSLTNGSVRGPGGGVCCQNSSPTLTNNIISGNEAWYGGGVYCCPSSAILTNNTISGNSAATGGGVHCQNSSAILTNNTIRGNSATGSGGAGGGGVYCASASPRLTNNTISGNLARSGGGVLCYYNSSPTLTNNTISDNSATDGSGGGVYCSNYSSPTLTNGTIRGNSATGDGGGVFCYDHSSLTMTSNTVSGNSAKRNGGGVYCYDRSSLTLANNVISSNSATSGGGVYCYWSSPTLTNNTICVNSASTGGGVFCQYNSSPTLRNTIVAFNTKGGGLWADSSCKPIVTYCDLYGNTGGNYVGLADPTGKKGNINKNPLFYYAKSDFHEKSKGGRWNPKTKLWVKDTVQSPCIDASAPFPASPFANEPTPNGGRINMGAYGNTKYASKSAPKSATAGLLVSAAAAPVSGGGAQITVSLTSAATVQVSILNLAGREVALLPPSSLSAGLSTILWDGKSKTATKVPAGRYLARVTVRGEDGGQSQTLTNLLSSR